MANSNDNNNPTDLGFIEESEYVLKDTYFPCKVGGKPAWLELKNLPNSEEIKCPKCYAPRVFLCQIYAPIEERDDCYHRTIYIFICKNESCNEINSATNIVVYRSQLSRINDYYPFNSPSENEELPEIEGPSKLCHLCGCYGRYSCSACKKINYCGQLHQKLDWTCHKHICGTDEIPNVKCLPSKELLFPEYEIVIERENSVVSKEITEDKWLEEYERFLNSHQSNELEDISESELSQYVSEDIEDKQFSKFKKRIASNPKQVLRYQKNGKPLWITDRNGIIEDNEIPNCENCGNKRIFEFQIMPQLLNYLEHDNIDWGILAIYTCSISCDTQSKYLQEFIFKQDTVYGAEAI